VKICVLFCEMQSITNVELEFFITFKHRFLNVVNSNSIPKILIFTQVIQSVCNVGSAV